MRHPARFGVLILAVFLCGSGSLLACGDKLLSVAALYAYSASYAALHPANVVLYLPGARSPKDAGKALAGALKRAGHDVSVVTSQKALAAALAAGNVDVVVANVVNVPDADAAGRSSGSVLVPAVFGNSPLLAADAAERYGFAADLTDPKKGLSPLFKTIDDAMGSRASHVAQKR